MTLPNKNDCPSCGQPKTSWSARCRDCDNQSKRLTTALERRDSDIAFLMRYRGWTLSQIGTELGVSRERSRQLLAKAKTRLHFLELQPITAQTTSTTTAA